MGIQPYGAQAICLPTMSLITRLADVVMFNIHSNYHILEARNSTPAQTKCTLGITSQAKASKLLS